MKSALMGVLMCMLLAVPVFAGENPNGEWRELGAKADAPNLIRLTDNLTIGVEAFKDTYYTNSKEGWGGYAKIVWTQSVLDFLKDMQKS